MISYVFILLVFTNGGASGRITTPTAVEFNTQKACEEARRDLGALFKDQTTVCVAKG